MLYYRLICALYSSGSQGLKALTMVIKYTSMSSLCCFKGPFPDVHIHTYFGGGWVIQSVKGYPEFYSLDQCKSVFHEPLGVLTCRWVAQTQILIERNCTSSTFILLTSRKMYDNVSLSPPTSFFFKDKYSGLQINLWFMNKNPLCSILRWPWSPNHCRLAIAEVQFLDLLHIFRIEACAS